MWYIASGLLHPLCKRRIVLRICSRGIVEWGWMNVELEFSHMSGHVCICVAIFSAYRAFGVKIRLLEMKLKLERCSLWHCVHLLKPATPSYKTGACSDAPVPQAFTSPSQQSAMEGVQQRAHCRFKECASVLGSWGFSRIYYFRCCVF